MRYLSTRGRAPATGFSDVLIRGLAPDGGLYVPTSWPQVEPSISRTYSTRAAEIMQPFIGDEISPDIFLSLCEDAYSVFRHADVAVFQTDFVTLQVLHAALLSLLFAGGAP